MIWPILEARAEIQKYFRSFFGSNEDIQKSFWNYLNFRSSIIGLKSWQILLSRTMIVQSPWLKENNDYTAGNIFPLDFNLEQRIQNLALSIHLYWVLTLKIFWILCASFWIDNDQNCWIKDPILGSQIQNILQW